VKLKWEHIRESQMMADRSNKEWRRINDAINDKHRREDLQRKRTGNFPLTDLMKAKDKESSLPLKDALGTGSWHARNAERHIHDVNLFLRLKELDIL
jgi:hypothetical protein